MNNAPTPLALSLMGDEPTLFRDGMDDNGFTHAPTPSDFTMPPDPPNPEMPTNMIPQNMFPSNMVPTYMVPTNDMPSDFNPNMAPVDIPVLGTEVPTTSSPSEKPTVDDTDSPTFEPTTSNTGKPTHKPTKLPTDQPTHKPTRHPTDYDIDTDEPSYKPTHKPSRSPTLSEAETALPTESAIDSFETDLPTESSIDAFATEAPTPSSYTREPTPTSYTRNPSFEPTASPSFLPTLAPTTSSGFFQSSAFMASFVILLLFIGAGVGHFWWSKQSKKESRSSVDDDSAKTFARLSQGGGAVGSGDVESAEAIATEKTSLLTEHKATLAVSVNSPSPAAAAPSSSAPGVKSAGAITETAGPTPAPVAKFNDAYLGGGNEKDAALMGIFTKILTAGMVINLHTTKGPRPVRFSLQGDEVRWEAAAKKDAAGKRYKLKLADVNYVEVGKATSNFQKDLRADENLCFSLVTQKTTLDLETLSKLDRDSLARGFQISIDRVKGTAV